MKKRVFCISAVLFLLLILAACGGESPAPASEEKEGKTTTLMIYMVGSDLEPKSGAGTSDLQEIAESGIDLKHNRVVVCAGGAPLWHNEAVDKERLNVLSLEKDGFVSVAAWDSVSMGEKDTLSRFLHYGKEHYPADEYALILWDHGNGPLIGYGKDLLYGNDALVLAEIRDALEASPFKQEEKLAWIGFDACLMASAELNCLLAPYGDYLVSSQEIEPAFGWNYGFLEVLGKVDTPTLLTRLTEEYLAACDAYYQKRDYANYDVTLSVADLSYAKELEAAVNGLFEVAAPEVAHYYDLLAKNRLESRALGRATTGSEYDLVDLKDMTDRLATQYPKEAAALLDAVERMVIANVNSVEGSCGMSLYYPFFNKQYYEKDWKRIYSELCVFPSYLTYLSDFEKTWLRDDKLDLATAGIVPQKTADKTYSVPLSPEQAQSFGSATYRILERMDGELYRQVYSSQDVVFENNTLTATYDGMALYVKSGDEISMIPPLVEVDTIGRLRRYSGVFFLNNLTYKPEALLDSELPAETSSGWRYLLTLNQETGEAKISGTVPAADGNGTQILLEQGRVAEADLSLYGAIEFYNNSPRYITRYDNGAIRPLGEWYVQGSVTGYSIPLVRGYRFEYAPLAGGEYYLMFEVTDTQSGSYCTELLPISVPEVVTAEKPLPERAVKWEAGEERLLLKEEGGVRLFLITRDTEHGKRYYLEAENENPFAIRVRASEAVVNGNLKTGAFCYFTVAAEDFMYEELTFGTAEKVGDLADLRTLSLDLFLEKERNGEIYWEKQRFVVDMTHAPATDTYPKNLNYDAPYHGAMAEKQVIYEDENLRFVFTGIGSDSADRYTSNEFPILVENLSQKKLRAGVFGVVINGRYFEIYDETVLLPQEKTYLSVSLGHLFYDENAKDLLDLQKDEDIASLAFVTAYSETGLFWGNKTECIPCPVVLSQHSVAPPRPAGTLLWEEGGIRMQLIKTDKGEKDWYAVIENNTDRSVGLYEVDVLFDGKKVDPYRLYLDGGEMGPGQYTVAKLHLIQEEGEALPREINFRIQVRSLDYTEVLFTAENSITLTLGQ